MDREARARRHAPGVEAQHAPECDGARDGRRVPPRRTDSGRPFGLARSGNTPNLAAQRSSLPYQDGIIVCMKKTLHIDEHLLREAKSASGAKTDTDTVRLGLEALIRRAAYERLRALRGSEPRARDIRRRRERSSSARHSAA